MRILIVSYRFPPFNTMGAVRVGKMAKYLHELGHEVRVVSAYGQMAHGQPVPETLPLSIDDSLVLRTPWLNLVGPLRGLGNQADQLGGGGDGTAGERPSLGSQIARPLRHVAALAGVVDSSIGWYPYAVRGARRIMRTWKPDLIYASAWPVTSLCAARAVSIGANVPWVAELRDPWAGNPYADDSPWLRGIALRQERRVLGSALGLVTVSQPWAQELRTRYGKPTAVILNGYDPEDFPSSATVPYSDGVVRITYTGQLYAGRRDPSPLFEAMRRLGPLAAKIAVTFHGPDPRLPLQLAEAYGLQAMVQATGPVPYRDALKAQCESDVLLLLTWNVPRERGFCSGKLFEYVGARRPILLIGAEDSVSAQVVAEQGAGVVSSDPEGIAAQLESWVHQKGSEGAIPSLPAATTDEFTREHQARRLSDFFEDLLRTGGTPA